MNYKPYRQILTFFDLSKKCPTAAGDISTLEYELSNHLNTFYNTFAPVRAFRTGAFCFLQKNFEKRLLHVGKIFRASVEGLRKGRNKPAPPGYERG